MNLLKKYVYSISLFAIVSFCINGCAIHYHDQETNTEHVWGFGHLAMTTDTSDSEVKSIGQRIDTGGLSFSCSRDYFEFGLGWNSKQHIEIVDKNSVINMAWPSGSPFYEVRIGSGFIPKQSTDKVLK